MLPNYKFVVGVSGGRDSMALLHLCAEILPRSSLIVAHYNHNLRGKDSLKDRDFVETTARRLGIRFICEEGRGTKTDEASLRKARIQFFKRVKKLHHAQAILLAHHAEDQLETFLMRLIRGSGMEGLRSMSSYTAPFFRPLLKVSRTEINEYVKRHKIKFREDKTNREPHYFRNLIRHHIVPGIFQASTRYGGKEAFLDRFSNLTEELNLYHHQKENEIKRWMKLHGQETSLWFKVTEKEWAKLSLSKKADAYRKISRSQTLEPLSRKAQMRFLLKMETDKRLTPQKGMRIEKSCGFIYFIYEPQKNISLSDFTIQLSPTLKKGNELRFFKPGDYQGGSKLKTLFLKKRIPAPERAFIPVLAKKNSSEVVWFYPQPHQKIIVKDTPLNPL